MPVMGEVQMNLTNMECEGQNELCKVVFTPIGVESNTGDCEELDYIEADSEAQGEKIRREPFYVTRKDSDCIDIEDLY
ncbi:MAG: hypothetical protein K2K54_09915 [Lachnospiraceae bacterium]|nr:hypothetical protein [Lachnospiraceae bacterium]